MIKAGAPEIGYYWKIFDSREGIDTVNSFSASTEPGIESELIDLDAVPFTALRDLDSEAVRHSAHHVVERTRHVRARYRSAQSGGGERID
ncbi:hypothetical protein [Amycolatopsis minnesotensis]|uniref:FXSXX-COOH protein n=1 Tax=Amycolatopsis minnesotensis TaxID=337894 RepID=A0ABN2RBL3_9PSEU